MNWKDEAADYLKNYGPMRTCLESIPLELSRLELEAKSIRSSAPRGVPGTRRFDAVEGRLLNNLAMRTQLQFQLDNAKKWVAVAEKAMEALSREDRLVLEPWRKNMKLYPQIYFLLSRDVPVRDTSPEPEIGRAHV